MSIPLKLICRAAIVSAVLSTAGCSDAPTSEAAPGATVGAPTGVGGNASPAVGTSGAPAANGGAPGAGAPGARAGAGRSGGAATAGSPATGRAGMSATGAAGTATASAGMDSANAAGATEPSAGAGGSGQTGSEPTTPVTCGESMLKPGTITMQTPVGGRDGGMRTYYVHVPDSYDGTQPVGLMVNFHPLIFGTGMGQLTGSGWAQVGDRENIITAFPDGYDAAWDIGNCCTRGDVDDMGFARAIVEEISKAACIDPNRVYASGYSMGGGMSHLLGCKASDIFAAVAPSAFDLTEENHIPCEPVRPITVFMHRGMGDTVVPYAGGPTTPPNGTPVTVTMLGAVGSFDEWSRINHCTDEPATEGNCQRRSQCDNGVEVVLCENGSHTEGPADVIWETLKKHGLSGPL